MEASLKLARQYFLELPTPEPQRVRFIARKESYHGTTLGALSVGGHVARRALYNPILMPHTSLVSACNAYRGRKQGESNEQYVQRLAQELDDEFRRVGSDTVCAFVAEPVVGAVSIACCSAILDLLMFSRPSAAFQPYLATFKPCEQSATSTELF